MATDIIARGMASGSGGVSEEEVKRISQEMISSSLADFKNNIVTTYRTCIDNYEATCESELIDVEIGSLVIDKEKNSSIETISGEWWLSDTSSIPEKYGEKQFTYSLSDNYFDVIENNVEYKLIFKINIKPLGMPFVNDADLSGWSFVKKGLYKYGFYTAYTDVYINETSQEEKEFISSINFNRIYFELKYINLDPDFVSQT